MSLTLYKDCMLRSNYQEIMRSDILEEYLETLSSLSVTDSEYSYFLDSGSLAVSPLSLNGVYLNQNLNYGKLERDNNYSFYFFVQSMNNINNAVKINYVIDVWATFGDSISWHPSFVERCSYIAPSTSGNIIPQSYEMPRTGRTAPVWTANTYGDISLNSTYTIVAKIQLYTLASSGSYAERLQFLGIANGNYTAASVLVRIKDLLLGQGLGKIAPVDTTGWLGSCFYEVLDLWIINSVWRSSLTDILDVTVTFNLSDIDEDLTDISFNSTGVLSNSTGTIAFTDTVDMGLFSTNGSTLLAYGLPSIPIELTPNGLYQKFAIYFYCSPYDFEIYTQVNGNRVYFTEAFSVDIPWTNDTADVVRQLKNNKLLQNVSASLQLVSGVQTFAKGIASTAATALTAGGGSGYAGYIYPEEGYGVDQIISSAVNLYTINNSQYTPSRSNNGESTMALYNASLFPAICNKAYDNGDQISLYIMNYGLSTNCIVEDLDTVIGEDSSWGTPYDVNYCYIRFKEVNIYGGCTNAYLNAIERIFLQGTRIYTSVPT